MKDARALATFSSVSIRWSKRMTSLTALTMIVLGAATLPISSALPAEEATPTPAAASESQAPANENDSNTKPETESPATNSADAPDDDVHKMKKAAGRSGLEPTISPETATANLASLSVLPEKVLLRGKDAGQRLVVCGHYADGSLRDLTRFAWLRLADSGVARYSPEGIVTALQAGKTELIAEFAGQTARASVAAQNCDQELLLNFANDVVPIFSKLGCNSGQCHGKVGGQNGFRLSLFGYDPKLDYETLTREGRGRRLMHAAPEQSLLLSKPTGDVPHGGGLRLNRDSSEYALLHHWIRSGTPFGSPDDPKVVHISVSPERGWLPMAAQQQLLVTAHYRDGSRCDATQLAEFSSNDDSLLEVDERGVVTTLNRPGEGTIMIRYLGQVATFRGTLRQAVPGEAFIEQAPENFVDRHVFAKLKELRLPTSGLCSDETFLRRAALDITGTLPTPEEVEKFLADKNPQRRAKLVDELLSRPEYASFFALKWADLLRNRRVLTIEGAKQNDFERTKVFTDWLREATAHNKPYDRFVRELLTANGQVYGPDASPPASWYSQIRDPKGLADDTAQVFLGTRMGCAQCHHHPYEKWTQDDYWDLAAFFGRVRWKDINGRPMYYPNVGVAFVETAEEGNVKDAFGRVYENPRALEGEPLAIPAGDDPRERLVEWMVHPSNPFFAKALVNRYWGHFFYRGIVEPVDDLRASNPPSNPALLDALAQDFIENHFDIKHLIRTICTSAVYQLDSVPNRYNAHDLQNFSHYYPKRLQAEVLLDAIDQVTGSPFLVPKLMTYYGRQMPWVKRAIDIPDNSLDWYFLRVFGKPDRQTASASERDSSVSLGQKLHVLNSEEIRTKLTAKTSRVARLAADPRPAADKICEVYLRAFARRPTATELHEVEKYVATSPTSREAYEDLIWALINTKEFMFNR